HSGRRPGRVEWQLCQGPGGGLLSSTRDALQAAVTRGRARGGKVRHDLFPFVKSLLRHARRPAVTAAQNQIGPGHRSDTHVDTHGDCYRLRGSDWSQDASFNVAGDEGLRVGTVESAGSQQLNFDALIGSDGKFLDALPDEVGTRTNSKERLTVECRSKSRL